MERLIRHHFVRFCLVGGFGFLLNFALLTALYKAAGWPLFVAQLLAGEIALFSNFLLHHNWTYKGHGAQKSFVHLLVQFHATSWIAIIGTAAIVSLCVNWAHMHYFSALVVGGALAMAWNFIWSKYVIWRKREERQATAN